MSRRLALGSALLFAAALGAVAPADARTEIHPYLEVQQVFTADFSGHDQNAVTYTGLTGGLDAELDGKNVHGQIDYRYDRWFPLSKHYGSSDTHNGLARIDYEPTPDLTLQAAAIAIRAQGAYGVRSSAFLIGDQNNTNAIYAIDVGPHYSSHLGDLDISASYDFGWTKSTDGRGSYDLGPGLPVLQNNFATTSHTLLGGVGMRPFTDGLPIGWKVSGGYIRDDIHFLDARYVGTFARGDITLPVSDSLALTAGAGYETNRASQDALLTDAAGNAILDDERHLQADPSKPRLLSYDQDGLIWDVGVIWRPSARTYLEAHVGRRYGGINYYGQATYQISPTSSIQVVAYSDVQSFGRQLTSGINALPTSFNEMGTPFASPISLCVFGANGGAGGCLPALVSANSNFYRSRGVYAVWSGTRGRWTYGVGITYDWRRYLQPTFGSDIFTFDGRHDQTAVVNGSLLRQLSEVSSITGSLLVAWTDSDVFGHYRYWTYGGAINYSRHFSRRLTGNASLAIGSASGETTQDIGATGLLGLRYEL
jgi:hypothetical protein